MAGIRCSNCNKFVSTELDADNCSISGLSDADMIGEVECTLICAECSNEVASASVEVDITGEMEEYEYIPIEDATVNDVQDEVGEDGKRQFRLTCVATLENDKEVDFEALVGIAEFDPL